MSLSLVVKTAKHRMLGLHAAVISPPEQRHHSSNSGEHVDVRRSEWEKEREGGGGIPSFELDLYVQMLVFQELKLVLVCISLMVHNVWSAQRRVFARLRAFKKLIQAQMRLGHTTKMQGLY